MMPLLILAARRALARSMSSPLLVSAWNSGLPGYRDLLLRFFAKRGSRLADVEAQILPCCSARRADHEPNVPGGNVAPPVHGSP